MTRRNQHGSHRDSPVQPATRILIVDSREVSKSLTHMLSAKGYDDVRAVLSGARALLLAETFRPGVVFLELELPDRSGYDIARQLQAVARGYSMRLIALTSCPKHAAREDARAAGFERYLVKPVEDIELDKILQQTTKHSI